MPTSQTIIDLDGLREMHYESKDAEAIRALRKIWLEAVMVESFEDVASLFQSAIIPD